MAYIFAANRLKRCALPFARKGYAYFISSIFEASSSQIG